MRAILSLSWLLLFISFPGLAQTLVLRGRVLDAETQQPIPNAQVGVAHNRIGTSTNLDGRFALPIPPAYQRETLEVVLLGYEPYRQPLPTLPGSELRIALRLRPAVLGEVTVSGSVLGIVREAVARIPQNYPVRPTRLEGFFRESDNERATGQYRYLGEAVLTALKAPYTQPQEEGEIIIRQSRKVELPTKSLLREGWYAGPFIPHRFDFVHKRLEFINEADFKNYDYKLTELTTYNDQPVYVITFGPKPGNNHADFEGRLYVDQQSYAFLAAEWKRTPAGLRHEAVLMGAFESEERAYRADYQRYAGRWHLKSVWYNTLGKSGMGPPLRHLSEFLTTAIDTSQRPAPGYTERAQFRDVFLNNTVRYDSAFWQSYTTLLPPEQLRLALRDQQRQVQAEQLFGTAAPTAAAAPPAQSALMMLLGRLRYSYGFGLLSLKATAADVQLDFAPAGSSFQVQAQRRPPTQSLVGWYGGVLQLDVTKNLAVQYINRKAFWNYQGQGWEIAAIYEHNFRPRHRPIFGRVGVAYTQQQLRHDFGTYANPDGGLRVADTKLGADEVNVALQQRTTAWQPKLGLGLEFSRHLELVADAGLLLPISTQSELHLAEKSGFFLFRNAADLKLPATSTTVLVNSAPAATPWRLGRPVLTLALLYRLR
jgi:hypothetical protein